MISWANFEIHPSLIRKEYLLKLKPYIVNTDFFEGVYQSVFRVEFKIVIIDTVHILVSFLFNILINLH